MTLWSKGELIEQFVRRDIPLADRRSIVTFNDLPDSMIAEARAIARESRMVAVRYLQFFVEKQDLSSSADFIQDVLLDMQDARTWGIKDCLWGPHPLTAKRVLVTPYLEAFAEIEGERWFRVKTTPTDRRSDSTPGMIGLLRRNVRYWERAPELLGCYLLETSLDVEPISVDALESSIRRWMAHILAWWAKGYLDTQDAPTGDGILSSISELDPSQVTADARIAATALAKEAAAFAGTAAFSQQAGFVGPDEWYAA